MRILVVGTGSIGRRHIGVIKSTGEHEIVICDINEQSVKEAAEQYEIKEFYYDYKEALKANIEAAIICTPNAHHADVSIDALALGCNVLVEKPLAHKVQDGKMMVEAAKGSGKVLMVGYILRVYPGLNNIKEILDKEMIGKPVSATVHLSAFSTLVYGRSDYRQSYETGGGIIYDYSHEIDYLRYLFGEPHRYACFKDLRVKKSITCDDIAEMILQFETGVLASVHMDYIQECDDKKNGRHLKIICEKGIINYDFNGNLLVQNNDGTKWDINYKIVRDELFLMQFNNFIKACNKEPVNFVKGEDGLAVLKICDNLYKSDRENIIVQV